MNTNRRVLVDLEALKANFEFLKELAAPADCGAVVKANAYGLGAIPATRALSDAGCRKFFVATLGEALELRTNFDDIELYTLEGPDVERLDEHVAARAWPAINDLKQARAWSETGQGARCLLQIDSGMNRLGLGRGDVETLVADDYLLQKLRMDFVITHLGCSDEPDHPQNLRQLERFDDIRTLLPEHKTSIASSPGMFLSSEYHGDLARPGVCLYGARPELGRDNPMQEVARIQGRIVQIREIETDDFVGYGATEAVPGGTRLATIAYGYADGYPRSLSSTGSVKIGDFVAKVTGRVSMDVTVVDITAAPPDSINVGDWATLVGDGLELDDVAKAADTISYEILTRIGPRVARAY
ncbi:MAG: alanine racemase [Woeseiaceae bacterium]